MLAAEIEQVVRGLLHRARTGRGTFIDLSQVETAVYALGEWLLGYTASGASFGRIALVQPVSFSGAMAKTSRLAGGPAA